MADTPRYRLTVKVEDRADTASYSSGDIITEAQLDARELDGVLAAIPALAQAAVHDVRAQLDAADPAVPQAALTAADVEVLDELCGLVDSTLLKDHPERANRLDAALVALMGKADTDA